MRVRQVNHNSDGDVLPGIPDVEVSHLKVRGAGVDITLIQRPGEGIDVTINPTGEDYMHNVKVREVHASSTQVRISGAKGSPL